MKLKTKKRVAVALVILILAMLAAMMTISVSAKTRIPRNGKYIDAAGHIYIMRHGKPRLGHFRYKGRLYYGHRTSSATYPKGSCTAGDMRIEKGNRWYAYGTDGAMIRKDMYVKKGRTKRILQLDIRSRDHTVRYVYGTARGSIGSRYSTAEGRMQYQDDKGKWRSYEGMPYYPPYVDDQR